MSILKIIFNSGKAVELASLIKDKVVNFDQYKSNIYKYLESCDRTKLDDINKALGTNFPSSATIPSILDLLGRDDLDIDNELSIKVLSILKKSEVIQSDFYRELVKLYRTSVGESPNVNGRTKINEQVVSTTSYKDSKVSETKKSTTVKVKREKVVTESGNPFKSGTKAFAIHETFYKLLNKEFSVEDVVSEANSSQLSSKVIDAGQVQGFLKGYSPGSNWETNKLRVKKLDKNRYQSFRED